MDWNKLRDYDGSGDVISDEVIVIPAGAPHREFPEFWPESNSPSSIELWTSANKIGTQYTEKGDIDDVDASGDFHVNYIRGGLLTAHEDSAGLSLFLSYNEIGTYIRAERILNPILDVVGSGDVLDAGGNVNLRTHANDDILHTTNIVLDYYLTNDADSGIGGYLVMQDEKTGEAQEEITNAGMSGGDDQLLATFITPTSQPGFEQIEAGVYDTHIHAARTAGTRTVRLYWTLSKRTIGGVETVLLTSEVSENAITDQIAVTIHGAIREAQDMATTDRLVVKVYGNLSATPNSPTTVVLYVEGTTVAHVTILTTTGGLAGVFVRNSLFNAKGDLLGATADKTPSIQPADQPDGHSLQTDAASPRGVKWANPSGDGGGVGDVTAAENMRSGGLVRGDDGVKGIQDSPWILGDDGTMRASGDLNMLRHEIQMLPMPTASGDAANQQHVTNVSGDITTDMNARTVRKIDFDAKGDIIIGSADDTPMVFPVNQPDGHSLQTDAASPTGVKWANPSGAGAGDVTAAENMRSNGLLRGDDGAKGIQDGPWILEDNGTMRASGDLNMLRHKIETLPMPMASGDAANQQFVVNISGDVSAEITSRAVLNTVVDAVGDLLIASGDNIVGRFPVGNDNQVLTADSSKGSGVKWGAPGGAGGGFTWIQKSGAYTASDLDGILLNSTGGAFTITLPASPSGGESIAFIDAGSACATNNVTIARNGENIQGVAEDLVVDFDDAAFALVFDAMYGWRLDPMYAQATWTDQLVKGWISLGGADATINDSYNVSSVTDNGVGDWTINWDKDFANNDYALGMMSGTDWWHVRIIAITVESVRIEIYDGDYLGVADPELLTIIAMGDQ